MKRLSKSEAVTRLIMMGIVHLIEGNEKMAAEAFESADEIRKLLSDPTYNKTVS